MHRRVVLKSVAIAGAGMLGEPPDLQTRPTTTRVTARTTNTRGRRTPFVEAPDGTRLFVRDWGSGPPMVFAAPWGLNVDWFESQMTALSAEGHRCVGYDRRGHGRSDEPSRGYDFDTLADDLATVIERLDLKGITLVGHSMGAGEVVRYVARHGAAGRVARVVLIAPITPQAVKTADNPDGVDRDRLEQSRRDLSADKAGQIARAAPAFFATTKNTVSAATVEWWIRMMVDGCSLKVMVDLHRTFTEIDFRPDLRAIAMPSLVIHGDSDVSTPLDRNGRRTAQLIAGSRLIVYENAGHGLPITHADRLTRDLATFKT